MRGRPGTQSIRPARAGHHVLAVEPDQDMRAAFSVALNAKRTGVRSSSMYAARIKSETAL